MQMWAKVQKAGIVWHFRLGFASPEHPVQTCDTPMRRIMHAKAWCFIKNFIIVNQ